jgi:hypothetical protein
MAAASEFFWFARMRAQKADAKHAHLIAQHDTFQQAC